MRRIYGKASRKKPGVMNRLEAAYADYLEDLKSEGRIVAWCYEPERLILANRTTYLPDFRVVMKDHEIQMHEVKGGHIMQASWNKLKIANKMHPYRFFLVRRKPKKDGEGWLIEEVK